MASLQSESPPPLFAPIAAELPAARRDPATSHDAARRIETSGERKGRAREAGRIVHRLPNRTALELAHETGADRHWLGKALDDAFKKLYVQHGAVRSCRISGNKAMTWSPGVKPPAE